MSLMTLRQGNNLELLKELDDNSVDSIVSDPPYGISFMNRKWDYAVPSIELWKETYRVLKPGGHMLIFCGTKTQHRMVINIEDAGFEIRDVITWLYGQGFPKSLDIGKAVDKLNGSEREVISEYTVPDIRGDAYGTMNEKQGGSYNSLTYNKTIGNSEWEGWGTALKPACEFITLVRKPISESTIAENVIKWGTGGINIDDSRIELNGEVIPVNILEDWSGFHQIERPDYIKSENTQGRWPSNLIIDSQVSIELEKSNEGVSRFFYCAKPSPKEKDNGLEELPINELPGSYEFRQDASLDGKKTQPRKNFHPTVKPIKLMEYLVRLITPKNGVCLDMFMGSGTTGIACKNLGFNFIGMEKEPNYFSLAEIRISKFSNN